MKTLFVDLETRSTCELTTAGVDKYACHPSTDVWCMAFAVDEEPVELWKRGEPFPERLLEVLKEEHRWCIHNANFEMSLWEWVLVPKHGFPPMLLDNVICTMAESYAMGLPGSLEKSAIALGIEMQKDMKGSRLAVQLSKPRHFDSFGNPVWWDDPLKFEILYAYCKQDVEVQRQIYRRTLRLTAKERKIWKLDYIINRRGLHVDTASLEKALVLVEKEKERLDREMKKITNNAVGGCNSVAQILRYLKQNFVDIESVAKGDVSDLLKTELPPHLRKCLEIRQEAAKSSTAKIESMLNRVNADNRMRGLFQYHGAHTGRWAGRGPQPQNFPRLPFKDHEVQDIFQHIKVGERDHLELFYGPPIGVISKVLRAFITASPGKMLLGADFSSIEARVLAWLAGQRDVLTIFETHGMIYEHTATQIYGGSMNDITPEQRQIGKVASLALGFGGGKGAFLKMAANYGVVITEERAEGIKKAWREANSNIVSYWYDLERAAIKAIESPGTLSKVGKGAAQLTFLKRGISLWCRLPSGRALSYPYARVEQVTTPWDTKKDAVTFSTELSPSRKWGRETMHGGVFCENVTQAVARDVLSDALLRLESRGFPVMLHTHDEIVCEVDHPDEKVFESIMTETPEWALGLPIRAKGFSGFRYTK